MKGIRRSPSIQARGHTTETMIATSNSRSVPMVAQPRALIRGLSGPVRFFLPPLIRALSRLVKLDKKIWVFGFQDMNGVYEFVDNSKYLFLAIANSSKGAIRPIWISWTRRLAITLKNRGYEAYWIASPIGLRLALQGGCVFSHMGSEGVMQELVGCGRALRVELWHGIPLKTVNVLVHADYAVATSESLRNILANCLGVHPSHIIVSGYPRNDVLLTPMKGCDIGVTNFLDSILELKKSARIVLYAPTFRDNLTVTPEAFMQYLEFDTTRLDHVLEAHGAYMIAKFHRLVKPTGVGRGLKKVSKRIYVINAPIDIYPILPHADVLVTDYSSVFFDFLLLDRPIVFYVPDCERYLRERGFVLNFDSYTPGPKAKSFEELLLVLDNVFLGKDEFVEQRKRVQQYAFDYVDGLSSGRVIRAVIDLLNLHATE